jgi:hypothetical protein
MGQAARGLEIVIGLFFLVTAGMKAIDIDWFGVSIAAYNVVRDPELVRLSAYITLISEMLIGAGLVTGVRLRGFVHGYAVALTVVFTGLIIYAWKVHGLEDCGCFGKSFAMGPVESILKNLVLIALIGWTWWSLRDEISIGGRVATAGPVSRFVGIVGLVCVIGIGAYGNFYVEDDALPKVDNIDEGRITFKFTANDKNYDLSTGDYLLVFLSATCEHCKASMPVLNILSQVDELPELVGLMLGTNDTLDDFIIETEAVFTTQLIDELQFTALVPNAPPWLVYVKDGDVQTEWQWHEISDMPEVDVVKAAVGSPE